MALHCGKLVLLHFPQIFFAFLRSFLPASRRVGRRMRWSGKTCPVPILFSVPWLDRATLTQIEMQDSVNVTSILSNSERLLQPFFVLLENNRGGVVSILGYKIYVCMQFHL